MKRYSLILLCTLLLLTGCGSKSSFSMTFDEFTMKFYDNDLQYMNNTVDTSIEGMVVLKQIKEQVPDGYTGFINSFVIFKTSLYS